MASDLSEAIRMFEQEKGIPRELVLKTIEEFLIAAYKKKYGTVENVIIRFNEEETEVTIFSRKKIVDDVIDDVLEIAIEDALAYNAECEIGDELLIEINPKDFERVAVQSAKQRAKQKIREIQKDTLYSEFIEKTGEMIIGYYQREKNGNIYVDLGKIEGILPKRFQSPREIYRPNDRIKAIIYEVEKQESGLNIILSRTHTDFVKKLFELEVPEVYDKTVEIFKIVREPGYRTKMAVYSHREDVDPVGACVGLKGVRIQTVVKEMEGEKIDVLKYDTDPRVYIKNALSPADVESVIILDEARRQALAVVNENQLSLAIGKQGLNVRLANRLVDWNIDVKTIEQFDQMDISADTKKAVSALFRDEIEEKTEEITRIEELPGIHERLVELLRQHGIELIETFLAMDIEKIAALDGITQQDIESIKAIIDENVEIIEENEQNSDDYIPENDGESDSYNDEIEEKDLADSENTSDETTDEDSYLCPDCGSKITVEMTVCPNCGVGLSFEEEEEDDDDDDEISNDNEEVSEK
ncbi:MAG: transcription termination/antitermination protein NusA [Spirochaetales bacterium]|nr:transcription termination/antitermination protein NusA [Spirochaetales bacterium]